MKNSPAAACGERRRGIFGRHLGVVRVAEGPRVAYKTASDAVLAEGRRVLIDDHRLRTVRGCSV